MYLLLKMGWLIIFLAVLMISTAVFWFLLLLADAWRLRRLRKKYNEYKDLSKQGEQARKCATGTRTPTGTESERDGELTEREFIAERFDKPERREFLPTTTPKPVRENSHSFRVSDRYKY